MEKHCAFLNCGQDAAGRQRAFADVSSAIGFEFLDDGRGLALVDWDFDGDLDVWSTNRTAPRVRFLKNSNKSGNHFIAFQLQGDGMSTNRDAIGARLELHVSGEKIPVVKTLHAGHAFLSQSSRWLHFGLGKTSELDKLVVRWPNGTSEEVGGLVADKFYFISQGQGVAVRWTPPGNRAQLVASTPQTKTTTDTARIVVPPGMRLPTLWTKGEKGEPLPYQRTGKGLFLVNLWASYCGPCLEELTEWGSAAAKLRARGIEVLALNTDGVLGDEDARGKALKAIKGTGFPFAWAEAAPLTVRTLDIFSSAVLDLWNPLPVPSTFLIDARGEVLIIYKGPVHTDQIIADAALASASPEERRTAGTPFAGRWVEGPQPADSRRVALQLLDRDETDSSIRYLQDLIVSLAAQAQDEEGKRTLGDAQSLIGTLLLDRGRVQEALTHLEGAREAIPHDIRIRTSLANTYRRLGKLDQAIAETSAAITINSSNLALHDQLGDLHMANRQFATAVKRYGMILKIAPRRAATRYRLANALLRNRQGAEAIAQFKQTLRSNPRLYGAANQLSRVLSSHPDAKLRSHQEAFVLSSRLCSITKNKNPRYLDTHATAAAASGNFEVAVKSAGQALELYQADPRYAARVKPLEERLALFRKKSVWVETEWE
jgi:tetratricopeptide (TPR) repeat protein